MSTLGLPRCENCNATFLECDCRQCRKTTPETKRPCRCRNGSCDVAGVEQHTGPTAVMMGSSRPAMGKRH